MSVEPLVFVPDWSLPSHIKAVVTTRQGGVSLAPFDQLNLASHVNDNIDHVQKNRQLLEQTLGLGQGINWLSQVHSTTVVDAELAKDAIADAVYSDLPQRVCAVLTADCLPVLFCTEDGTEIAAAHAGWKGLFAGVLEATVKRFTASAGQIRCWMGPAIGAEVFEVGQDVLDIARAKDPALSAFFKPKGAAKYLLDMYGAAKYILNKQGVYNVTGGGFCTFSDSERFYSYRRDGVTGRMATLIWNEQGA